MGKIYVIGLGPGNTAMMTNQARNILNECDVIAGYSVYIDLIKDEYPDKELLSNGMTQEIERCKRCAELAQAGKKVALVCSGDAGVYGMASPLLMVCAKLEFTDVMIVPGISAAMSGAAELGAPINHDFCVISLSDRLTPFEMIEKRLRLAAQGDFCVILYNPSSKGRPDYLRRACDIMLEIKSKDTCCGYVRNIGRDENFKKVCTLGELKDEKVDMFTTVFVGNSNTRIENEWLITPRGYVDI